MKLRTMWSVIPRVLLLVICVKCASSIVPAPVNVTVVCKNFQTVVSWTYSQQVLDPLFRVYLSPTPTSQGTTERNVPTGDLQYDLSGDVWKSLMSSRDAYTASVAAVSGDQESTRSKSPRFTFNELHRSLVQILCTLDLPPVELRVKDRQAIISFPNPMRVHPELHWAKDIETSDPLSLIFDVTEDNVTHRGECRLLEQTCTLVFPLPSKGAKHCFSLNARLKNDIQLVEFTPEDPICGKMEDAAGSHWLFLGLLLAFFILVVCSVGFMVWKSKACVQRSPSIPPILDPKSWPSLQKNIMDQPSEMVCFLSAYGQRPSLVVTQRTPDPGHDQDTLSVDLSSKGSGEGYCGQSQGSEDPEGQGSEEDPEGQGSGDPEGEESEDPEGEESEEDPEGEESEEDPEGEESEEDPEGEESEEDPEGEEVDGVPVPDYDRPHLLDMDMGDGDMVKVYGL